MSDIRDWLVEAVEATFEEAAEAVAEAAEAGADAWRDHIATTPRKDPWARDWTGFQRREGKPLRFGSSPGAVHTGRMIGAIQTKMSRGANRLEAEVGWLEEGDWADYFEYQEMGFKNVLAGVTVKGLDSQVRVSDAIDAELKRRGFR